MKRKNLAWQVGGVLLCLAIQSASADELPSNPETDESLRALGVTIGNGMNGNPKRGGYYVLFEKTAGNWKISAIETRQLPVEKPADKEILFFSMGLDLVEPNFRDWELSKTTGQITCRSGMINKRNSGRSSYNPCDSSLTSTIDAKVGTQAVLTVLSLGLNVLTGTGVRDVAVDKTKVLALLEETKALERVREKKAADDRQAYLNAFTNAKSSSALNAFIQRYTDNDPDELVPQAIELRDQAKANEYRRAFENATTVAALDAAIQRYQGNDPEGLISKALERRKLLYAAEQKEAQIQAVKATYQQMVEAGRLRQRIDSVKVIGTKICNSEIGVRHEYQGLIGPNGPVTRPVAGIIKVTGFTEGVSGDRVQIRAATIVHTNQTGNAVHSNSYEFRGIRIAPGQIFWDEAANWAPC